MRIQWESAFQGPAQSLPDPQEGLERGELPLCPASLFLLAQSFPQEGELC